MSAMARIERTLNTAIEQAEQPACPPRLAAAMRYAVFPGGARVRPRLCLAVARACGDDHPRTSGAAAAAIELLHCASLVHDDLPCFDDAATRRGKPSVHRVFGEPLAVLTGDALIVLAFQALAEAAATPPRFAALIRTVAGAVGVPNGIATGQAWECESTLDLGHYQRAKTGALFAAAAIAGAEAAGLDGSPWRSLGERLGEAYQVADDIRDVVDDAEELGKPVGRDAALGRPSAVAAMGLEGALRHLHALAANAVASIPACSGAAELRDVILSEAGRLVPRRLAGRAA